MIEVNPKESVLFVIILMETILSLEITQCEINIKDKVLLLNINNKNYNKKDFELFTSHYDKKTINSIFDAKIIGIKINNSKNKN